MDAFLETVRNPVIHYGAALVGVAGFTAELLAARTLAALKLQPGQRAPAALVRRILGGGTLVSLGVVVFMLGR